MKIPFIDLISERKTYLSEFEEAEKRVLNSGCYIGGAEVENFERELKKYLGGGVEVATCGSGTSALMLALLALEIHPGDEVIVPDFSFIAPAECIALLGGVPIFASVNYDTMLLDICELESLITPKTKGIIAVDLFGNALPYEQLETWAHAHNLWVIEDAAQAFGSTLNDKKLPQFGDIAITSFYPSKPLGCYGDGGAIFSKNKTLIEKMIMLKNHGSSKRYHHEMVGINSRLDALQAAILNVKLKHFDDELQKRRTIAKKYDNFFKEKENVKIQKLECLVQSSYAQYTIRIPKRAQFIKILEEAQIPYAIHYPAPLHLEPCFAPYLSAQKCTLKTQELCNQVLSLPMSANTPIDEILERLKQTHFD